MYVSNPLNPPGALLNPKGILSMYLIVLLKDVYDYLIFLRPFPSASPSMK